MATIHELLKRVSDDSLRAELEKEVRRLTSQKKFGLVFEEHLPEATPLYGMKVRVGMIVATYKQDNGALFVVREIAGDVAKCVEVGKSNSHGERGEHGEEIVEFKLDEIVPVAKFGDPIYPVLQPMDKIEHGGGDLWHTLIQADNYHALQLLEYLYPGQVDCIYIDPPYNTGARDWKYNNDYVDKDDAWRHSKWLSMMQKRLAIAKRLLNPKDSVLIVTIDEKEYLHLGMLLEEMFPEARIQMVSDVTNPKGVSRGGFRRCDEYIYFVMMGNAVPNRLELPTEWNPSIAKIAKAYSSENDEQCVKLQEPGWTSMMRRGSHSRRSERPGLYYAIYADPVRHMIVPDKIGQPIPQGVHRDTDIEGFVQILPIRTSGAEGCWQVGPEELKQRITQGRVRLGRETSYGFVVNYLPDGEYEDVLSDRYCITGRAPDGSLQAHRVDADDGDDLMAPTQWKIAEHNASENGSTLIGKIIGKRFEFPKSLYAVHDAIRFFVANKPNALIVDFFAGSGTTLHAVNLLNAEDGGKRRCILVTNNEVSDAEEKEFRKRGVMPGDAEWEARGIAQYVTWPRTTCSIKGVNVKGEALKGEYIPSKMPMSDGFKANCEFFKLAFVNKDAVSLGRQFKEILPLLWMRSGAKGARPEVKRGEGDAPMMVLPENGMAILLKEYAFAEFVSRVADDEQIKYVYLVTDSEKNYRDMARSFEGKDCVQIYRHYLDNFRINKFGKR